jgi:hypothetical protein
MSRAPVSAASLVALSGALVPDETCVEVPSLDPLSRDPLAGWAEWGAAFRDTRFGLFSAILEPQRDLRVRAADGLGRTSARVLCVGAG